MNHLLPKSKLQNELIFPLTLMRNADLSDGEMELRVFRIQIARKVVSLYFLSPFIFLSFSFPYLPTYLSTEISINSEN